jgi:cation diffusion facilitator family transporter
MATNKTVVYAAFAGNAIIAVTKFIAAGITGSSAMLSEGIHSVVDSSNQLLLLYGMRAADRPADARHPFGYSAEIYFWAFVVAILIFAVGSGLSFYEGFQQILNPHVISNVNVSYGVLIFALILESAAWYVAFREIGKSRGNDSLFNAVRKSKDPAVFAVLIEDTAACVGLVVAMIGIYIADTFNMPIFDGIASVVIGVLLALVAVFLALETKALLIGEAASDTVIQGIRNAVRANPKILRCLELNTMHLGPTHVIVNILAEFNDHLETSEIELAIVELEREITKQFPTVKTIAIEPASSVPTLTPGSQAPARNTG